uniref:Uncharacterized protein n=1 Tax=Clastoptera arizonana TaxID=38151 RepID=A0A1B6DYE9_9HEMI
MGSFENKFSLITKCLEQFLNETNHDKINLEYQCEEALELIRPQWPDQVSENKDNSETIDDQLSIMTNLENETHDKDNLTTKHIENVIQRAKSLRMEVKQFGQKEKHKVTKHENYNIVSKQSTTETGKSLSFKHSGENKRIQTDNANLDIKGPNKKIETVPIEPLKVRRAPTSNNTAGSNKALIKKNVKSISCYSSNFKTSYQDHYSKPNKLPSKSIVIPKCKSQKSEGSSDILKETKSCLDSCKEIKIPAEINPETKSSKEKSIVNLMNNKAKINLQKHYFEEHCEQKTFNEVMNTLAISPDMVYVLKLYHKYLNGIKCKNDIVITLKAQFIKQYENISDKHIINFESRALLYEQCKKYLIIYKKHINSNNVIPFRRKDLYTSYNSLSSLITLEEKQFKLQKLKMQLNLSNLMLETLSKIKLNEGEAISVFKTFRALSDLLTLSVPIIIPNQ